MRCAGSLKACTLAPLACSCPIILPLPHYSLLYPAPAPVSCSLHIVSVSTILTGSPVQIMATCKQTSSLSSLSSACLISGPTTLVSLLLYQNAFTCNSFLNLPLNQGFCLSAERHQYTYRSSLLASMADHPPVSSFSCLRA